MYRDKARGEARELVGFPGEEFPQLREGEALLFQLANGVQQLKRLVDALGSSKDTVQLRQRITDHNARIQELAKQVQEQLKRLSTERASMSEQQAAKTRKLMQDFGTMLQEYKATQKVAAEREAQSLPRAPPPPKQSAGSSASAAAGGDVEAGLEATALLQQQQQVEARHMDNAIAYNEALIEERDHNISEITRQIGEVNEMFQDLAVLINDQGDQLQTIDVHIASTAERVREGQRQLVQAERSQRAARNKCLFVWLMAGVVVAVILIVLFS